MTRTLATRRARVARINAKRPRGVVVEADWQEYPASRGELVDLLLELLESRRQSGGR